MTGEINPTTAAKKDKVSPALICTILTIWMIIGIIVGFAAKNALIVTLFLLPVAAYEIYRTRGETTTFSSWMILIVLVAEAIFIIFKINYDLGQFLGTSSTYVGGQIIPLGDIKVLGPTLLAVFSVILFVRTAGPYTKWLSVIIFISAFMIVYILGPEMFKNLIRSAVQNILWFI